MRVSGKRLIIVLLALGASVGAVYWWWASGGGGIVRRMLAPRFRVLSLDAGAQTAELQQTNRIYTVRCGGACGQLVVGRSYAAVDGGSELQIEIGGQQMQCPIIKIEVRFDVRPGGVGSYVWSAQKHSGRVPY